jgi:hypothetical protein
MTGKEVVKSVSLNTPLGITTQSENCLKHMIRINSEIQPDGKNSFENQTPC